MCLIICQKYFSSMVIIVGWISTICRTHYHDEIKYTAFQTNHLAIEPVKKLN